MVDLNALMYNTIAGRGPYPIINPWTARPLIFTAFITPFLLYLLTMSRTWIGRYERLTLALWLAFTFCVQLVLLQLTSPTLESIIRSPGANSFYSVTLRYSFHEVIREYLKLLPSFPEHAHSNMPGKIFFFYLLELVTQSPAAMAIMIIILSNVGGLLMYFIALRLFDDDKTIALYSMVFYLLTPIRFSFFPLMNVISPLFILASLLLLLQYIEKHRHRTLIALGISLYFILIFDPIPLVLGFLFCAYLVKDTVDNHNKAIAYKPVVMCVAGAFVSTYLLFILVFQFDAFSTLAYVIKNNSGFYSSHGSRKLWYLESLTSFLYNCGVLSALLFLFYLSKSIWRFIKADGQEGRLEWLSRPAEFLSLVFFVNLLLLNFSGVNRAEVPRYWIFMCPFLQLAVAYYCVKVLPNYTFPLVTVANLAQSAIALHTVGMLFP